MAKIKVTLVKSTIGQVESVKATVKALGLKKIRSSIQSENTILTQKETKFSMIIQLMQLFWLNVQMVKNSSQ